MALELLATFSQWTSGLTLIPGGSGQFEVNVNGDLVYSKKATGRFPELDPLKGALRKYLD